MWNGKNKALTFSYDDGVEMDRRLVGIFNNYGMKCTFNLNSGIMTPASCWEKNCVKIRRMSPEGLPELYKGHEIAVHCSTHPDLTQLTPDEARREIMDDKKTLESLFGCEIKGMAYPYGTYNDTIVDIVKDCGIKYSRTCEDTHGFALPEKLLTFGATCHHDYIGLWALLDRFLAYDGEAPALFCVWGHSYEFSAYDNWSRIERFCKMAAGRDDIFYGTNSEVFLG